MPKGTPTITKLKETRCCDSLLGLFKIVFIVLRDAKVSDHSINAIMGKGFLNTFPPRAFESRHEI